jgi:uncharacterized protein DUF5615
MRIYLDDDSVSAVLIRLLIQSGHDVQTPANAGLVGDDDSVHLIHAVVEDRVMLSHNHGDFQNLHNLVAQTGGVHPGIFMVRRENNPHRDMIARDIVQAIGNLLAANVPIENQFVILNHWR